MVTRSLICEDLSRVKTNEPAHLDTLNPISCLQQRLTLTQFFRRSFEVRQIPARVCSRAKRHPRVVELEMPAWGRVRTSTGIRLNCFLKWSNRPLLQNARSQVVQYFSVSGHGRCASTQHGISGNNIRVTRHKQRPHRRFNRAISAPTASYCLNLRGVMGQIIKFARIGCDVEQARK